MDTAVSWCQYRLCRRQAFFYGLGLGEEKPHPELPGLVSVTANEFYARHFFSRWRNELQAVEGQL